MIVGVTGFARSGKDSFGRFLQAVGYQRIGFADQLKAMALEVDPLIVYGGHLGAIVRLDGWERAKDEYPEVRRFLQNLGLSVRERFGTEAWVNQLATLLEPGQDYVVTDVRFPNEADWVHRCGGYVVRIDRPGVGPANDHPSEHQLDADRIDWVVDNSGDLGDLEIEARRLARAIDKVRAHEAAPV